MNPEKFAFAVGVAVFAAGSLGLLLHRVLPEKHLTGGGKDMLGAVVGMVTLLSALVLGLLIWTAYGVYAGQNIAIQTLAAKALQLDLALSDYGPEANGVRAQVRQALGKTIDEIWGSKEGDAFIANNFATAIHNMRAREASLASLHPSTDAQKDALAAARAAVELGRPIPPANDICAGQSRFHSTHHHRRRMGDISFFAYGLMSGGSVMSFVATTAGALAIASAAYLILDLSSPYSGLFRPSSAPFEQVMAVMGKE